LVHLKTFLKFLDIEVLIRVCADIDDLSDYKNEDGEILFEKLKDKYSKKDFLNAIMTNVYTFGLNHLFSLLTVDDLIDLCSECRLSVNSRSKDTIIDCLIEQKDYEPEEKSEEGEASEKKPDRIKKGIKKVDLISHFTRPELLEYCQSNQIKTTGKKSVIASRIMVFLGGDRKPILVAPPGKRGRKRKVSKSTEEKSEEKSDERKVKRAKKSDDSDVKEEKS